MVLGLGLFWLLGDKVLKRATQKVDARCTILVGLFLDDILRLNWWSERWRLLRQMAQQ